MNRSLWLLLLAAASVSLGLVQGYSVAPRSAAWSGWTSFLEPNNYVSQVLTCSWDQLDEASGGYCELFCGDQGAVEKRGHYINYGEKGTLY
jgi:hypothetical protein